MVNFGVIGVGRMGKVHIENIQKHIEGGRVYATSNRRVDEDLAKWLEEMDVKKNYSDYNALILDKNIDAILIASPVGTHKDISIKAIRNYKHIFCEKPMDHNLKNINDIMIELENSKVKYQVGFNRRYDADYKMLKEILETQNLGQIYTVRLTSKDPSPPSYEYIASSGGHIMDSAIHEIDLIRYLTGEEVVEVYATGAALIDKEVEKYNDTDVTILTLKLTSGAFAMIDITRKSPNKGVDRRVEILTDKKILQVNNNTKNKIVESSENGIVSANSTDGFGRFADAWISEIQEFVNSIIFDRNVKCSPDDGMQALKIALAANLSLKKNIPIKISEIN